MHFSFLKHKKKSISPMKAGKFLVLVFVNKLFVICCTSAYSISDYFLTSQIVKRIIFNIGFCASATSLKPARGLKYSPFFISKISHSVNNF